MLGSFLGKYFIPHKGNDYAPHFLRSKNFVFILFLILSVEIIYVSRVIFLFPSSGFFASIIPSVLVADTNAGRTADNLRLLQNSNLLDEAAQLKANDMAAQGYFSHVSPTGVTPWHWLDLVGYNYEYAGENLAVNFTDSQDVINAWMNSPEHRANILNVNFSQIGIAIAKGTYQGNSAIFVVQFFGRPVTVAMQAPVTPDKTVVVAPPLSTVSSSASTATVPAVKGETIELQPLVTTANQPSLTAQIASGSNSLTNNFYIALLILASLVLTLTVFAKSKIQHSQIIVNGLTMILLIALVMTVNNFITAYQARIF